MPSLMSLAAASAVLLSLTPATPVENTSSQTSQPEPAQATSEQAEPSLTQAQAPTQCPPGQFLSPFSDVYPTDWAFGAVVQLAGVPSQCFDLPSNVSEQR